MHMMNGTTIAPPQPLSGLAVVRWPVNSMQKATKTSDSGLAYEVRASARSTSPNFPSSVFASPPIDIRRNVDRNLKRPERGR